MQAQTAQEVINALGAISDARFIAMDDNGEWWVYVAKPKKEDFHWSDNLDKGCSYIGSIMHVKTSENWEESLVEYQPNPEIKIQEYGKEI